MAKENEHIEEDMLMSSGYQENVDDQEIIEDEVPAGETPAGEAPAGETPAGETPAGEAPAGEAPAAEKPAEELKPSLTFENEEQKWVYQMLSEGKDDEVLQALNKKHGYKTMSEEDKAILFLKSLHPSLDDDDLEFKAKMEYGIGEQEEEDEYATDADKALYKARNIKRKELLYEADNYFSAQAEAFKLPALPSVEDSDPDYKSYKEFVASQAEQQATMKEEEAKIIQMIDTASVKVETIEIKPTIQLDDREFSFVSEFKLDENKRKQLAEFAKTYTPSQEEQATYFPEDGKFNMEGYLGHLATIKFSTQIINAAVKQGIAKAREEFVEKDLQNSTLRNSQTQQQSTHTIDPMISAMEA